MDSVSKLIFSIIAIAIGLAASGKLVSATKRMAIEAFNAQSQMVSLGAWNRALMGETPPKHHQKHHVR